MRSYITNERGESIGTRDMIRASQIIFDDGRNLENVIKDIEKKIDELKKDSPYTAIIHNQYEFDDWVRHADDKNYNYVLLYPGEYILDKKKHLRGLSFSAYDNKTISLTGSSEETPKIICIDTGGIYGNGGWKDAKISNVDIEYRFTENYEDVPTQIEGLATFQKLDNVNILITTNEYTKNVKEIYGFYMCENINNCSITIKDEGQSDSQRLLYGFISCKNGQGNRVILESNMDTTVKQFASNCVNIEKNENSYYA